jgi:cysteine-rich repeat protein
MNKFVLAGALALAVLLGQAQAARAQEEKACDCNGNDEVVINELIIGVNILLGNAEVTTCEAADVNGNGGVQVNELVQCVNCANGNCTPSNGGPACGDGTTDTAEGEECDDGNNFNGDDCAGNCTTEQPRVGVFDPSRTIATVQTEAFPVIINLTGQQTFRLGKPRETDVRNEAGQTIFKAGEMPAAVLASELMFDPVRVTGLVCACVRGVPVPSFGEGVMGTGSIGCEANVLSDISYTLTQDHNTTPGDPGNRLTAPVGSPDDPECDDVTTLPGGTTSEACAEGDPNFEACANDPGEEEEHPHIGVCNGPRVLIRRGGPAPAGSAFILFNTAIGLLQDRGTCQDNPRLPNGQCEFEDYGPDCQPCTDDDLEKGTAENIPVTTGEAEAVAIDANNSESVEGIPGGSVQISRAGDCMAPCKTVVTGSVFDCDEILRPGGSLTGGSLAVAFPSIDAATIGDNVTTTTFFNQ